MCFATTLRIECISCEKQKKLLKQNIRRLKIREVEEGEKTKQNLKTIRNLRKQITRRNNNLDKLYNHSKKYYILPSNFITNDSKQMQGIKNIPNHELELNLRAIIGAFMIGTGGSDVGKLMTMMGVTGGKSFERAFYRSATFV